MMANEKLPTVSIIILNYNGRPFLGQCVNSVLQSNYHNYEIILIDNASTDNSIEIVRNKIENHPRIRLISNPKNFGFAEGNNIGIRMAQSKYVVLLNNDTKVDPDWLRELVRIMESDPSIGIAQSKLLLFDNRTFDSAGDYINPFGYSLRKGGSWEEIDRGQYDRIEEIFSARGAAMIVRRNVFQEVGLLDSTFFLTHEDLDFCWRARLRGYRVIFVPESIVYHYGRGALSRNETSLEAFHSTKNRIIMFVKNCSLKWLTKYNPLTIAIGLLISDMLVKRNARLFLARLKGIFKVIMDFRSVWEKRLVVQHHIRKVSDRHIEPFILKTDYSGIIKLFIWFIKYGSIRAHKLYFENYWRGS